MSANTYERVAHFKQTRVWGGDVEELSAELVDYRDNPDARWFVDGDFVVIEEPLEEIMKPWQESS